VRSRGPGARGHRDRSAHRRCHDRGTVGNV
ncbi:MAG: hypothetical protein AVDCRST_MAG19-3555, partial [uncultured Thermomicrobiales bacterium]